MANQPLITYWVPKATEFGEITK